MRPSSIPKTYLGPKQQRVRPPPPQILAMLKSVVTHDDAELIDKNGLDSYLFLRYLKTLLIIFVPVAVLAMPILLFVNFFHGREKDSLLDGNEASSVGGLDVLSWANVQASDTSRYGAHLVLSIAIILWVCAVFFLEFQNYAKIQQCHIAKLARRPTSYSTTVLVTAIPGDYLDEQALSKLFTMYPGQVKSVVLNRDVGTLLGLISRRDKMHSMLETAETDWRIATKKAQSRRGASSTTGPSTLGYQVQVSATGRQSKKRRKGWILPVARVSSLHKPPADYCTVPKPRGSSIISDESHRPKHRLNPFGILWLPGLPILNRKVDTICWCREELHRLNTSIENEQRCARRLLIDSAFIEFEDHKAAQIACQCAVSHVPLRLHRIMGGLAPESILWTNLNVSRRQNLIRQTAVALLVAIIALFWAVPVASTAALSNIDQVVQHREGLSFVREHPSLRYALKAVAGVLPAAALTLMITALPAVLDFLAWAGGARTRREKVRFVQRTYFVFLFIQIILVVSAASFIVTSLSGWENVAELRGHLDFLYLLAMNLPSASNYFFSYMLLQAFSTSSSTLLQAPRILYGVLGRALDKTPREKWQRDNSVPSVDWSSVFPLYTIFACISLIYCVIAPLISLFAVFSFSLMWIAHRYAVLYVCCTEVDTGGALYPCAINQTFVGLYAMQSCLAVMFLGVRDGKGEHSCLTHGFVMMGVLVLTVVYQVLLNVLFSPMFRFQALNYMTLDSTHQGHGPRTGSANLETRDANSTQDEDGGRDTCTLQAIALRDARPTIWIPALEDGETQSIHVEGHSPTVPTTTEGAYLDGNCCARYTKSPPPAWRD